MAKTYTKSEMTPELLHLNLLHFFEAPSREYKAGIDEIVLSTDRDEERWLKIMNHWHDFMTNPPVESTQLPVNFLMNYRAACSSELLLCRH